MKNIKKLSLSFDDSLIISRLQQKELAQIKPNFQRMAQALSPLEKITFDPIIDNLPIKIGLSLNILGVKIISAQVSRGFYYQDLENRLSTLSYTNALKALGLLNQKTPIFYQLAFTRAIETLCAQVADPSLERMRVWALTYARVYHHVQVLADMLLCLELDNLSDLASTATNIMKPLADRLVRVHSTTQEQLPLEDIPNLLENLENLTQELESGLTFESSARMILRKKAVITLSLAASFGLSGIYLRANRSHFDTSSGPNDGPPLETSEGGDAWARFYLRILDIKSCLDWLKNTFSTNLCALCDNRDISVNQAVHNFAFGEVSGPEGDIKVSIFVDKFQEARFYLRSPAYFIAQALPHLLAQADLSDLPWILYSLGIRAEEIDK